MSKSENRRFERQIAALTSQSHMFGRFASAIQGRPGILLRLPLGLILIAGGFLSILPIFGLWMLPLGLLTLAIDLPWLRPFVSGIIIRLRRKWSLWRHKDSGDDNV